MKKNNVIRALRQRGFCEGRLITFSKSGFHTMHPNHFVIFNSKVFTRRALILRQADLDLTVDAVKLTAAAREVGENFYVLAESHPHPFWQPGSMPMRQVLCNATWWTRLRPEDQDVFLPVNSVHRRSKRLPLTCVTGLWQGRPAYSVACWENDAIYNTNMTGAALDIAGQPPKHFRIKKSDPGPELSKPPSATPGQTVHPLFYQKSGLLEYVWFSGGFAMPAALYDQVVRPLGRLDFTLHDEHEALHIRRDGRVIGMIWPCFIGAREVAANARRRLGLKTVKGSCSHKPEREQKRACGPNIVSQKSLCQNKKRKPKRRARQKPNPPRKP
ncbi:MAG TPA: hypothetical protein VGY56_07695 [Verrucomicrobiae bacterium]|nr:hypothetical protein [Verrucomicrobiae bacterium]